MPPFRLWTGRLTPDSYKALLLQLDDDDDEAEQRIRMELERRTERNLRRVFRDMMETLYPEGWGEFVDPNIEATRVQQAFQREQELRDALSRALQDGADLGVSVAVQQMEERLSFSFDWTLSSLESRRWALAHTDELLQQLGTTSSNFVGQAIGRWVENGEPLEALIGDLEPMFGRQRSEMISSTEVTRAFSFGSRQTYLDSGVVNEIEIRTSMDERVCNICGPLHGVRGSLETGVPGQGFPPFHVRCRCWIAGVVE